MVGRPPDTQWVSVYLSECCLINHHPLQHLLWQNFRFHSWPVDEIGLLVDHDRFGDGGHARASWRLWAWAKCLQELVKQGPR